jgi:membrane-associated phospholipid phosphatase
MRLLIFSGILYLAGVAIVLSLKPALMFTEQGVWKEFGIGKSPETHTWLPFWLFCILWSVLSYLLCVLLAEAGILPGLWVSHVEVDAPAVKTPSAPKAKTPVPGYYMLNTEGSGIEGVPKYIYLGPAAPGEE